MMLKITFYIKEQSTFLIFALETWYNPLKEYTARTVFIELSKEITKELYELCNTCYIEESLSNPSTVNLSESLSQVISKVDSVIKNDFNGKAFVKLSTRSPKDAITEKLNSKMEKCLIEELSKSDKTENGDAVAFVKSARRSFIVKSGFEALDMLRNSSRIREDLMKTLEFPDHLKINLIVREWIQMEPEYEFRAFVYNHQLNALSQYCYLQFFDNIQKEKQTIEKEIKNFFSISSTSNIAT